MDWELHPSRSASTPRRSTYSRVLHVSQASLGHLLWIPPAGWEAGYLFWGRVADRRNARALRTATTLDRPTVLFLCFCAGGFLITLAPLAAASPHPVSSTMLLFFLQMFVAGGFVVLSLSDGMNYQPPQNSGLLAGVAISSWALVTGLLIPVLGRFFDLHEYQRGFWLVAALPVLGTALWKSVTVSTSGRPA